MPDRDHDRPGKEATRQRWEDYKQLVLARLVETHFAPVYGGLQNAKPSGDGWMLACCPLHEDEHPSFGYSPVTGQWSCFSGCGKGDVFTYLERTRQQPFKDILLSVGDAVGVPRPSGNGAGQTVYPYRDEGGALLYEVLREPGKKFWQRRPKGDGTWINDLKNVRRVLYRLPEVLARRDEVIYIVEGEKDVDRLLAAGLLATTNSGGAGKWRPSLSESLRGRDAVIVPDNDAPGRAHALQIEQSLRDVAASARIVTLPGLPEKGDVSDWLGAGHTAQELQDLVGGAPAQESLSEEAPSTLRPVIQINGHQLEDIYADAWRALLAQNDPPRLFVSAEHLARLVNSEGGPGIQHLDNAAAYGVLVRAADWVQRNGDKVRDSKPPKEVAADILANPHPDLPLLDGIVSSPVFDAAGRLLVEPGYHASAHLWLHRAAGGQAPDVPCRPTEDEVADATALLCEDLLVDFPFTSESDLAHALAAFILPSVRRMIDGPTPIHLIEAPTPGSGKGLLAELTSIVTVGRSCESTTVTRNEDESRKKLTAILSRGRPIVVIDNIQGALESAQLAAAITAEQWSDRILGRSQMVEFPNRALWIVTGNNPKLSMEIARRCVRIRLEPREERPWERTKFKHSPIRGWAREHRSELVRAVLIIVQSWIAAGRPPGAKTLGSFEDWATTIGGILRHAGVRDFLADTKEFYQAADFEAGEWRAFIAAWHEAHQSVPVTPTTLLDLAEAQRLVPFAYAGTSEQGRLAKFGKALSALRGRRFGPLQVVAVENRKRCSNDYRLVPVAGELFSDKEASE